ncbi:hypothetical protein LX36DRAFT_655520 [Colletotrichum falcatum]|nr:hypothetical protein LX36DRAFT_655520 [Colletotrichum falcatum]
MIGNPRGARSPKERGRPVKIDEDNASSSRLAPRAAETVVIHTPDDEDQNLYQNVQGVHSPQVKRLSARLAHDLRPMLHEYVREKLTAVDQDAAAYIQKVTRSCLSLHRNGHFGFSILRDVEVSTVERLANETSALIESLLDRIVDPTNIATSQQSKRSMESMEEAAAEGARAAKRQRTRGA